MEEQVTHIVTEEITKENPRTSANIGLKGLKATGRFMTKILDLANRIDSFLYGHRLKWFAGLSFAVVVIAPIIDWARDDWRDRWTAWSTIFLFAFLMVLLFAWIGSLRDDEGNWSFKRVRKRIWTYVQINFDFFRDAFNMSFEEMFYRLSTSFIIGSFCWKALQNVSVLIRKPYEGFFETRWNAMR